MITLIFIRSTTIYYHQLSCRHYIQFPSTWSAPIATVTRKYVCQACITPLTRTGCGSVCKSC